MYCPPALFMLSLIICDDGIANKINGIDGSTGSVVRLYARNREGDCPSTPHQKSKKFTDIIGKNVIATISRGTIILWKPQERDSELFVTPL